MLRAFNLQLRVCLTNNGLLSNWMKSYKEINIDYYTISDNEKNKYLDNKKSQPKKSDLHLEA